jgi:transcriptional regulator with XRE-family HTH domain
VKELDLETYKKIGSRIREVRTKKGMSQAQLAEKAYISVPHVSEIECGKSKLRLSTFVFIAEALQVSADVLLRPNIPEVNSIYQGEFNDVLDDCSPAEMESILKIVKELKATMRIKKDETDY